MNAEQAQQIHDDARQRFLEEHPAPGPLDEPCPQCKALPGQRCLWGYQTGFSEREQHKPRQERWTQVCTALQQAATDHADHAEADAWRQAAKAGKSVK